MTDQLRNEFNEWVQSLPYYPNMAMINDNYKCPITQGMWRGFLAGRGIIC